MKTVAVVFPFDLFGSPGTGTGAQLLGDALREMLADAKRETRPARANAYRNHVRLREFSFETMDDYSGWRKEARRAARQALRQGEFLLWLAGNHLGVLPVYEGLGGLGEDSLVLQLDAHLDIYNLSDCTEELSHGNFLLHAESPLPAVHNVGHRDLFLPPEHVAKHYRAVHSAAELASGADRVLADLKRAAAKAGRVFIDIDCDVFDPAFFPASAHPLPFGLAPAFALRLLEAVWSERVCGVAVSEFDPARDRNDQSLGTLVWLLEWLLLRRYEETGGPG